MTDVVTFVALIGVAATAVIHGTDLFCALVLCPPQTTPATVPSSSSSDVSTTTATDASHHPASLAHSPPSSSPPSPTPPQAAPAQPPR
jgi:hypothetical protein